MNFKIRYSILRYVHSKVLDESLNVGVLAILPSGELKFSYASDLSRLRNLYEDFRPSFLKSYLGALNDKVRDQNQKIKELSQVERSTHDWISIILRHDDTSLEFGPIREAAFKSEASLKLYLSGFVPSSVAPIKHKRHDEHFLKSIFSSCLAKNKEIEGKVKRDSILAYKDWSYKIDFEWVNGTTNLVKALSFDLQDASSITNKIAQATGYLYHFRPLAEEKNYRFDLLVAPPQKASMFQDFDRAIKNLEDVKTNKRIIEENDIKSYSEQAIAYLSN